METNGKVPLISTKELEARSATRNDSQENDGEEETSLPALTNELIEAQHSQCAEIAECHKNLSMLKVRRKKRNRARLHDI